MQPSVLLLHFVPLRPLLLPQSAASSHSGFSRNPGIAHHVDRAQAVPSHPLSFLLSFSGLAGPLVPGAILVPLQSTV